MFALRRLVRLVVATGMAASAIGVVDSPVVVNADSITGQTISTNAGTAATSFSLSVLTAATNQCQGNTATGGYRWGMYVADSSVSLDDITVVAGALAAPSGYVEVMYSTLGDPQVNKNTSSTGQITGTTMVDFLTNTIPGAGQYNIGYYCSLSANESRHWTTQITVTDHVSPTNFNWVVGAPASIPPFAVTAVGGNTEITGTLTPDAAANPPVTEYKVIATPQGGGAPVEVIVPVGGPYAYTISGLTNGTLYDVTATATNAAGTTTTIAAPVVCLCGHWGGQAPVVTAASGPSPITVSWTPRSGTPLAGATLVSHTISITPVGDAPPITIGSMTVLMPITSVDVSGNVGDCYVVAVVGNFSNGQQTATGTAAFCFHGAQIVVQNITVVRPQGALVLSQRCGVHGSAPAYSNAMFGPTFPALTATASADPSGTAPNVLPPAAVGVAPLADAAPADPDAFGSGSVGSQPAGQPDGLFDQYPYPVDGSGASIATYATNCGIDLNTASLITSGPSAGQYFRATGRIAQLTVVDTRDADDGWTLNGQMSNFSSGTDSFSGNLLGWVPEVTWDSNPNLDGYDMTVAAGNTRLPVASSSTAGLGDASNSTNTTLANSLSKANAGAGLGMAVMDARINLLIPVSADAGTYSGVLTFTII